MCQNWQEFILDISEKDDLLGTYSIEFDTCRQCSRPIYAWSSIETLISCITCSTISQSHSMVRKWKHLKMGLVGLAL